MGLCLLKLCVPTWEDLEFYSSSSRVGLLTRLGCVQGLHSFIYLFLLNFNWSIVALQCCVVSTVQQNESVIHIHISPILGFPSHLCHHSALSRVPCTIQYALISYLFYT